MVKWCSDIHKFNDWVQEVQIAYENIRENKWGVKYNKTPEECLDYLNKAEQLLNFDESDFLSFVAIFKIRDFYELKGKILLLLQREKEACICFRKALEVSSKDKLEARLSKILYLLVFIAIAWMSLIWPLFK